MGTTVDPYQLPPGRLRRDRLHDLHLPVRQEDLTSEEQADLAGGLERLRSAVVSHRKVA